MLKQNEATRDKSSLEEAKLNRLTLTKETIQDLIVPIASEINGGATVIQKQSERIKCAFINLTESVYTCD